MYKANKTKSAQLLNLAHEYIVVQYTILFTFLQVWKFPSKKIKANESTLTTNRVVMEMTIFQSF